MEYPGIMRRAWPLLLIVLAILVIAWFLRPADLDESTEAADEVDAPESAARPAIVEQPPPRSEPRLEGRPDAVTPSKPSWVGRIVQPATRRAPRFRIHGTVRDGRGQPVHRARVYQLSHKAPQGMGWVRETAQTDAQGGFAFLGHPPAQTWICARCPRHRTVFLEARDVSRDGEVHLVLEEAPPLVVRFVDADGEPVSFGSVRAVPITRRGADCAYPGPESVVPEQQEMTDLDGEAIFRFEARVPVMVLPQVESMITIPREIRVPDAEGTVTFAVQSAGGLELKAVDEGGQRVRASMWVSVLDPYTGEELACYRGSEKDGALEVEPSLPPGPYHLDVSARGYEPVVIPDFVLPVGPAVVKHTVTLEPLGDGATLRLRLPSLSADETWGRRQTKPWVFLLRCDAGWEALGWIRRADFEWNAADSLGVLHLRPGTYEIALSRPQDGTVATLGPLVLRAGQVVEKHAPTGPGISFALYDVLPADLAVRAVRIGVPGRGRFPPTGFWSYTPIHDARDLVEMIDTPGSGARSRNGGGALLGPYPGPHVVLEVDDWSGRMHRFTVGR